MSPRRHFVLSVALLAAGCALPPDTALRDWARTASIAVDRPALLPPEAAAAAAGQQALAVYLYALGVLAGEAQPLTFRATRYAALADAAAGSDPALAQAVAGLGAVLAAACDAGGGTDAGACRRPSGFLSVDRRLERTIPDADPHVQALLPALAGARAGARTAEGRDVYLRILRAIGEDHAMLTSRIRHIGQRAVGRDILAAEDRLLRLVRDLPPDPAVAARGPSGGAVAAVVQP